MPKPLVLIVDDNAINLKLARVTLESEGYAVSTASSAEEAAASIDTARPALILMDIQLPGVDGLTLTRQLKADPRTRAIPVIALTAYAMKGDDQRAREAGCDGYLAKPIDTRALPRQIAAHLSRPKVVVLEDDPSFGKLVRIELEKRGLEVRLVTSVGEARRAVAADPPVLVVSDRRLKPDGDGLEFCRELKRGPATRGIRVVLLTGSEAPEAGIAGTEMGPDLYLLKSPETLSQLWERLESLLRPS